MIRRTFLKALSALIPAPILRPTSVNPKGLPVIRFSEQEPTDAYPYPSNLHEILASGTMRAKSGDWVTKVARAWLPPEFPVVDIVNRYQREAFWGEVEVEFSTYPGYEGNCKLVKVPESCVQLQSCICRFVPLFHYRQGAHRNNKRFHAILPDFPAPFKD